MHRSIYLLAVFIASTTTGVSIIGCAAGTTPPDCSGLYILKVSPTAATADHSAAAPGNQAQFQGAYGAFGTAPAGCAATALSLKEYATWQNPDPLNISISSAVDETNGTAVCTGTTAGAVTLTGSFTPNVISGPAPAPTIKTVTLTCR
jgi:hypothetical protein